MRLHPKDADEAMKLVVRVATTGTDHRSCPSGDEKSLKSRRWKGIAHSTCYGKFVPDTEDENHRDTSYRKSKPTIKNFE